MLTVRDATTEGKEGRLNFLLSAVLVIEEDVDGGGWAAVNVRVPATGHVFHKANVTGSKHVPGPITGANLDFAGQMNDQPAFGQWVEVHLSGPVKLLHPDLLYIRQWVVYGYCAANSEPLKTRYDQPISHLIRGADHEIRPDFLSVRLGSPHSSGSVVLSVLARRQSPSSGANAAETQT